MSTADTARTTISDTDVSIPGLRAILDAAYISSEQDDDGDVYAFDGIAFPIWVCIDRKRKLIQFHTYVSMQVSEHPVPVDEDELLRAVNGLNRTYLIVQFHAVGQTVVGNAWMSYEGGLLASAFVRMAQRFSSAFAEASRDELLASLRKSGSNLH